MTPGSHEGGREGAAHPDETPPDSQAPTNLGGEKHGRGVFYQHDRAQERPTGQQAPARQRTRSRRTGAVTDETDENGEEGPTRSPGGGAPRDAAGAGTPGPAGRRGGSSSSGSGEPRPVAVQRGGQEQSDTGGSRASGSASGDAWFLQPGAWVLQRGWAERWETQEREEYTVCGSCKTWEWSSDLENQGWRCQCGQYLGLTVDGRPCPDGAQEEPPGEAEIKNIQDGR